jgi:EpsI family protein
VAWQWYWADGAATAGVHRARARVAWSRIRGRGDDAAVVVLHAPAGEAGGEAALEAFSRSAGAAITHLLNETRNRR